MDHLSTGAGIGSQIGALELGDHLESHSDGALLRAVETTMSVPQPTAGGCTISPYCRGIGDGALESAGASMALGPTLGDFGCGAVPRTNYCVR
jgi:hypothetical protein